MGKYTSFTQSNKNEGGRYSYKTIKFMDRKSLQFLIARSIKSKGIKATSSVKNLIEGAGGRIEV